MSVLPRLPVTRAAVIQSTATQLRMLTWPATAARAAGLGVLTVVTRLLVPARYLFNWDSIQFALGIQRFDLAAHRPHPPGYLGYIVLGRLASAAFGGDAQAGLVALSVAAEVAAVVAIYLFARRMWSEFAGVAAALLLATSPLFWIYGRTALTYSLEALLVLLVVWLCYEGATHRRRRLVLAAAVVAAAGAIRPTTEAFLLPVLGLAMFVRLRSDGRGAVADLGVAAAALALLSLAWVVPLMILSGGPITYLRVSGELGARVAAGSSVFRGGPRALLFNSDAVVSGLALGLGLFLPMLVAAVVAGRVARPRETRIDSRFVALGAVLVIPAVAVYAAVHIGQLGYVLLLLPVLLLPAGVVLERLAGALLPTRALALRNGLLLACAAFNIVLFLAPHDSLAAQVAERDRYGEALVAMVSAYDPSTTVLVTEAEAQGSYRMAEYYLPAFTTIALGTDVKERAGEMFSTAGGAPEYDLARFRQAGPVDFPSGARQVLVLDPVVLGIVGDRGRLTAHRFGPDNSWKYWTIAIDPANPPARLSGWVYLRGDDCPCRGAGGPAPLAPRTTQPR